MRLFSSSPRPLFFSAASLSAFVLVSGCQSETGAARCPPGDRCGETSSAASTAPSAPATGAADDDKAESHSAALAMGKAYLAKLPAGVDAADLNARTARYATPTLTADVSHLSEREKEALALIIQAARELDPIFDRQAWRDNPVVVAALTKNSTTAPQSRAGNDAR